MSRLTTILYVICALIFLNYGATMIMGFFGIEFEVYAPYLFWLTALGIFYALLPGKTGTVFSS